MKLLITTSFILLVSITAKGQNLQAFADSIRQANHIPEIGYSIVTTDTILELHTLGYHRMDLRTKEDQAKNTDYFHLGSNTKAITGFIAAYLVEKGKIKWTTRFFDLFPMWQKESHPAYHTITLAALLSHRAKIQPYTSGLEYKKLPQFKGAKAAQRKQFVKYLLKEEPIKENSQSYQYSNAGYSVATLMLEKITGKTWEQLVDEVVSKRLQLHYTFSWPNKYNIHQPWGHWIEKDTLRALPPTIDYTLHLAEPAGDISMPLPDYTKFIQLNLQGLAGQKNLLQPDTYKFLHFGIKDYSIGWQNVNTAEQQLSEHAGSAGTFYAYTLLDQKRGIAYIVVANSATENTQQGLFTLLDKMIEKYR